MTKLITLIGLLLLPLSSIASDLRPEFAELEAIATTGTLVVPVTAANELPSKLESALATSLNNAMQSSEFEGKKAKPLSLYELGGYQRVVLVGLGEKPLTPRSLREFGGRVAMAAGNKIDQTVSVFWQQQPTQPPHPSAHIAVGIQLGAYRFDKYKTGEDAEDGGSGTRFVIHSEESWPAAAYWRDNWAGVSNGVYLARDLISEPANVIYPESFVERARAAFKGIDKVSIKVLNERQMEKLGMNALLGVGMGSERPPRLLIISYQGADKDEPPLAFVGKGVTFDTGGISIKSSRGLWRMKYDMSGAAAVTGTVLALAQRKAAVNAIAIAPLVENMPSQRAQRPGDVRKAMSGKTIEIINTDAEGRLILADALWYAQEQFEPQLLVDVATLTGSIKVALGEVYAGLYSRHDDVANKLLTAGEASGEEVWRMPLHADFRKAIRSDIGDVKNAVEGGSGGANTAAEFVGSFVKEDTHWAHLDIAGKAWAFEKTATVPKGAAGWGVLLLNQLVADGYEDTSGN